MLGQLPVCPSRTGDNLLQFFGQLNCVVLSQLIFGKYALHYVVLVFFLNKTAFNSKSFLAYDLSLLIRHFFHPNSLLPFVQVPPDFEVPIYRSELSYVVRGLWRSQSLVQVAI